MFEYFISKRQVSENLSENTVRFIRGRLVVCINNREDKMESIVLY